jgi:mannose-6-phosphate isomerase
VLYPFIFEPRFKARVWGGRRLADMYAKGLPGDTRIGESWEISDRSGDESVIANGPFAGRTIRWLMEQHGREVLGTVPPAADGRFPLLCKILDARDKLSLQVHPPSAKAAALGGEPKTEMWYIADADPEAELFVGLRRGVTRDEFASKVQSADVAGCFHRIPVRTGDTMFLPSGRVHAIGAGLVIFEIQQNSDTTYRVFDWNRVGLDGKPRELHVEQSMASIDFDDFEPSLADSPWTTRGTVRWRPLVRHPLFTVDEMQVGDSRELPLRPGRLRVVAVVAGALHARGVTESVRAQAGGFVLLPASLQGPVLQTEGETTLLIVEPGSSA